MTEQMTLQLDIKQPMEPVNSVKPDLYIKSGDPRGILELPDGATFSLNTFCQFKGIQMTGGNIVRKVKNNPRTGAVDLELMTFKMAPPDYKGKTFYGLMTVWKRFTLGKMGTESGEDILTLERVCGIGIGARK